MAADLKVLDTPKRQVQQSARAAIRDVYRRVMKGEVVEVAIATVSDCGAINAAWSGTNDMGRLIGSVDRMKHKMHTDYDE